MAEAREFTVDGPVGRDHGPSSPASLDVETDGAIVYFHGGGFVLGSLDTHHRLDAPARDREPDDA